MKINKRFNLFFIFAVILTLAFTACFNGQQGNEASIVLNLGGSTGNRAASAWPHDDYSGIRDKLVYKVIIDGPDYIEIGPTSKMTIKTTVTPGIYSIKVEAWYLNVQYAKDSIENVTIKAGPNPISIKLKPWMDTTKTYLIADGIIMDFPSLADALMVAKTDYGLGEFTVSIGDGPHFLNEDEGNIENKVTIKSHGSGEASIMLDPPDSGALFKVSDSGNLTLRGNIILRGSENNVSALIKVYGILNMYDNVVIKENKNTGDDHGGGVCVYGEFHMRNGKISGNETKYRGGGVCVEEDGTFNMYDGIISGNRVNDYISGLVVTGGGGVYIAEGAFFHKEQGIIYGGEATLAESLKNFDTLGSHSVFLGNNPEPDRGIGTTIDGSLNNNPE